MLKKPLRQILALSVLGFIAMPAFGQEDETAGAVTAPLPKTGESNFRLIPVIGASSFTTNKRVETDQFNGSFSAGIFADFGTSTWVFETGIEAITSKSDIRNTDRQFDIQGWGIPLLGKINFTGRPHQTFFVKGGIMPFSVTGDAKDFDLMGVAGIGAHIPVSPNSSILLDASYNGVFTTGGELNDFQGVSLLAGISLNI